MSKPYLIFLSIISARTAIVLLVVIIGLRFSGKRQISQMNVYDLVMIISLGNAVQNAMTIGSGHISVGLVSSGTLLAIGWLLCRLFVRSPRMEQAVCGIPTVLISGGEIIQANLSHEHVTEHELMIAIHQHDLERVDQVSLAVLEIDGAINIVPSR